MFGGKSVLGPAPGDAPESVAAAPNPGEAGQPRDSACKGNARVTQLTWLVRQDLATEIWGHGCTIPDDAQSPQWGTYDDVAKSGVRVWTSGVLLDEEWVLPYPPPPLLGPLVGEGCCLIKGEVVWLWTGPEVLRGLLPKRLGTTRDMA